MILAVGTDIVRIARFEKMSARFMERVFTPGEQEYLLRKTTASAKMQATAAGLFAAKEAVAKALGTGFRRFWPCEIEITYAPTGAPRVNLHNNAAKIARKKARKRPHWHISITHEGGMALAVAIFSRRA